MHSGAVLMSLGMLLLLVLPSGYWVLLIAAVLFFSGFNYLEAFLPTLVARFAPAGEKGTAMGLYASFQFAGAFLGGAIAGLILSYTSPKWVFTCGVFIAITILLLSKQVVVQEKSSRIALPLLGDKAARASQLDALSGCKGVLEAKYSELSNVVHLKVSEEFDLSLANEVILNYSQA